MTDLDALEREALTLAARCAELGRVSYPLYRPARRGFVLEGFGVRKADHDMESDGGRATFWHALYESRRNYLAGRLVELEARRRRAGEQRTAAARGVSRFLPEGTTLEDLARVTLTTPGAIDELRKEEIARAQADRAETTREHQLRSEK